MGTGAFSHFMVSAPHTNGDSHGLSVEQEAPKTPWSIFPFASVSIISGSTPGMFKSNFEYKVVPARGLGTWLDVLADLNQWFLLPISRTNDWQCSNSEQRLNAVIRLDVDVAILLVFKLKSYPTYR